MIMMMRIKKNDNNNNDDYDKEKKEEEKYDAEDDDDCDEDDDIMMSYIVFIKSKRLPCYWVLFILQLVCMRGALHCDCHDDGRSTIWSSEVRVGIKWRTSSQRRSHNQGQPHHLSVPKFWN